MFTGACFLGISTGTYGFFAICDLDLFLMYFSACCCLLFFYIFLLFLVDFEEVVLTRRRTWTCFLTTGLVTCCFMCTPVANMDKEFDVETDFFLSQVPEDSFWEKSTAHKTPPDRSKLTLRDKPKFCVYTDNHLAKRRFTPPVGASQIKQLQ